MNSNPEETVFEMAEGRFLRFADGLGHQVTCLMGSLAVTRSGDPCAKVLGQGESYRCDGTAVVTLHALGHARVRLVTPACNPQQVADAPQHSLTWLAGLLGRRLH